MSVGHTYMTRTFPAPAVPTIPPDFDYCAMEPPSEPAQDRQPTNRSADPGPSRTTPRDLPPTIPNSSVQLHPEGSESEDDGENEQEGFDYLDEMDDRELTDDE
ncbi:hypothetical protein DFP72DRAFT_846792 [Ephemerocybe angulata]|uniref:Uncharacterized protein n=1 Tax=Ephemerocybe angulata TaxID=980116 RepID=A0A8H6M9Y3_9AGAR|nr:hypothetical protein DFP72DRAFT_846792 [Tulosesus angulatus]